MILSLTPICCAAAATVRSRCARGELVAIHLRRWPKLISGVEAIWLGGRVHHGRAGDRCLIYYNQPRRLPNFLAIPYFVSHRDCTLATFNRALEVLDLVAEVKRIDALVCDVWNRRISARLLARWGWEPHQPSRWHRNYIKRFYGQYPAPPAALADARRMLSAC